MMWKLAVISFGYIILTACYPEGVEVTSLDSTEPSAEEADISSQESHSKDKQDDSAIINQAIESMHEQFVKLSQSQIQLIKEATLKEASQVAKATATQIAANAADEAVENIEKEFTHLSESQKQTVKKVALDLVHQIAQDTATQIATNAANEAIESMHEQFVKLSQSQIQLIKEAILKEASQIAEKTANQFASNATNEAIENMGEQFKDLSESQKKAVKEAALQLATQTAEETANQVAVNAANKAIENMEQQFANFSETQKEAVKEAALQLATQTAEETANQVAVNAANEAIENMEKEFANLSETQKEAVKEAALELTNKIVKDITTQIATTAANKAIENMEQQFKDLSESQTQAVTGAALELATQIAEETANQVAVSAANEAIENMEKEFANLSETQKEAVKEAALQLATQTAEETANQVAVNAANEAIENMGEQFKNLSESQKKAVKEAALKLATQTAEETANQVAVNAANKAIENMEQQFKDLSESQKKVVKEAALKLATQTAEETANQVAVNAANEAIENMGEQFKDLSESQKKAVKEAALKLATQTAEETANQVAVSAANKAIENMGEQFKDLSESQKKAVKEAALKLATQTAEEMANQVAVNAANEAIENMGEQFKNLSESQKKVVKEAALKLATQTAEETANQVAVNAANKAIENMEQQFKDLSKTQNEVVKEAALELAIQTAEEMANQVAFNAANKAIENMEQQFKDLSKTQKEAVKEAALELAIQIAEETANQVAVNVVNEAIDDMEQRFIAITQNIEDQYSNLLKEGLRIIISAAIEAALTASRDATEEVKKSAIGAAKEIVADIMPAFNLPFEECNWTNQSYTVRLVEDHSFFPLSDPLKKMLEKWDHFQSENGQIVENTEICDSSSEKIQKGSCINNKKSDLEEDFAYLSPLYDNFILSFLKDTIKDTYLSEDDVPPECFFASSVRGANIYKPGRNFYYCDKDSIHAGNMTIADNHGRTRNIHPRRACLNRDYVYLTARAFNKTAECFGFDKLAKENIFKLFNHESTFLHNIKSPTGAKCYGQLTTISIKEINKQIYFSGTGSPYPYSYIFDEVVKRCPGLQKAVLDPRIYGPATKGRKSMAAFNRITSRMPISCKITQNPYSCLFYSFYNIKKNAAEIDIQLKRDTTSSRKNIPREFKEKFLLPIGLNAMVGVTHANGRDMIFWDDSEVWSSLRSHPLDNLHNIRKLPLFENEKEIKDLFSLWAYNGGISISRQYMAKFIRQLKRSIASPCSSNSNTEICRYRFAVASGQGLKTEDIKKNFQRYIRTHYKDKNHSSNKRRQEVTLFATNVKQSLNYLYNKRGPFKSHLKKLFPQLKSQAIDNFQDHLQNVCPKP